MNETQYLSMNCEMPPFTDRRVRQALNYAVNKERTLKLINGRGIVAQGVLPPNMPGYNPQLKGYDYNPERAKQLLAEAGYPKGFRMPLWVIGDTDYRVKIGMSVQQDLKEVGIEVDLKPVAFAVFDEATGKRKEVPACIFGWVQDYPDPSDFLDVLLNGERITDQHCNNVSFYASKEVDALLKQAAETADPASRLRLYQDAEKKVVEDAPWVFLYHPVDYRLVQPWVKGYQMHPVWLVRYEQLWLEHP
jgi:ABC-type transport system substrate-binding protein